MKPPFEWIVARHGATVLRVCRAVVGPSDADDAWSETFLSALRAYPDLPADANHEAWLVTIAHRRAIDVLRARQRRADPIDPQDERSDAVALAPWTARDPAASAGDLDLYRALAALPERQRLAVAYHHLAGLPFAEVAELLGGTPQAARKAGSDGIHALRAALATHPDGGTTP